MIYLFFIDESGASDRSHNSFFSICVIDLFSQNIRAGVYLARTNKSCHKKGRSKHDEPIEKLQI